MKSYNLIKAILHIVIFAYYFDNRIIKEASVILFNTQYDSQRHRKIKIAIYASITAQITILLYLIINLTTDIHDKNTNRTLVELDHMTKL